jgi:hypothetical protein
MKEKSNQQNLLRNWNGMPTISEKKHISKDTIRDYINDGLRKKLY